ncbi:MAG TPA: nuclear transport factor 2 family protein [Thermoleophilaceae bacterium]|jgi:ketosteroid isomerase-like protein
MATTDGDVVRELVEHWKRGEFAPSQAHLDRDVVIVNQISGRSFEGHGGIRWLISDIDDAFAEWKLDVEEVLDVSDDRQLVVGRAVATGRKTGTELDRPLAFLFTLEDGLIARIDAFPNRLDEAYAAAGLERPA